jgi:hypothetical protein
MNKNKEKKVIIVGIVALIAVAIIFHFGLLSISSSCYGPTYCGYPPLLANTNLPYFSSGSTTLSFFSIGSNTTIIQYSLIQGVNLNGVYFQISSDVFQPLNVSNISDLNNAYNLNLKTLSSLPNTNQANAFNNNVGGTQCGNGSGNGSGNLLYQNGTAYVTDWTGSTCTQYTKPTQIVSTINNENGIIKGLLSNANITTTSTTSTTTSLTTATTTVTSPPPPPTFSIQTLINSIINAIDNFIKGLGL